MLRLIACILCAVFAFSQTPYEKMKAIEIWGSGIAPAQAQLPENLTDASQVVLVEYIRKSEARITVYEKIDGVWYALGSDTAVVGKNGMGKTREGDGKTPLGVYNLTTPFGILDDPGAQQDYIKVTEDHYWCASSGSEYYNRLVSASQTGRRPTYPDEELIRYKGYYNYCMFIDYNKEGEAKKGSCIFLHCTGAKSTTGGCVAAPEAFMVKIIRWAREGAVIVLTQ